MYENSDHFNCYEDWIAAEKDFILLKDCWSIGDAVFLMTSFEVEYVNNGENDREERKLDELVRTSIIAKKLTPEYTDKELNYFKPETIINWAIERGIWREDNWSSFLTGNTEEIRSQVGKALAIDPRKETTYKNIIGVLLACINGDAPSVQKHKGFSNESELINYIDAYYNVDARKGLSKSTLTHKFPEARRHLGN